MISERVLTKMRYEDAIRMFEDHVCRKSTRRRWNLRRHSLENRDECEVEVVSVGNGLFVSGYIECCFFQLSDFEPSSSEEIIKTVYEASIQGAQEMVEHGLEDSSLAYEQHSEVFLFDLEANLRRIKENYAGLWTRPPMSLAARQLYPGLTVCQIYESTISAAVNAVEDDEDMRRVQHEMYTALHALDEESYDWIFELGKVISSRVIFAKAAVERLYTLLQKK